MTSRLFVVASLFSISIPTSVAVAQDQSSMAVMPLVPQRIGKEITSILEELLIAEVDAKSDYKVISTSDINAMLGLEKMKSAVGCDNVSCAAEIGGALGVDVLLSGSVGRLGSELIISLKLIDIQKAEIKERVSLRIPDEETEYAAGISSAVAQLLGLETPSEPSPEPSPGPEPTPAVDRTPAPPTPTSPPAQDPEPEPEADDDYLANSVAVGFGAHILWFEIEGDGWGLSSDPSPGEELLGATIEYRRKHSSYFTTKARALLGMREFYTDNGDVYVNDDEDTYEEPSVSSFGAMIGVFEEFTLPLWRGEQPWLGANPAFEIVAEAGFELMPPRVAPHMDLFAAFDVGGGIRFYWLTIEVLAVIPVAGAEQETEFFIDNQETCDAFPSLPGCGDAEPGRKNLTATAVNLMGVVSLSFSF